jgi:hypothetical protein
MSIEIGLFMGLCMLASYQLGKLVTKHHAQRVISRLLDRMNKDMDGEVVKWFERSVEETLSKKL